MCTVCANADSTLLWLPTHGNSRCHALVTAWMQGLDNDITVMQKFNAGAGIGPDPKQCMLPRRLRTSGVINHRLKTLSSAFGKYSDPFTCSTFCYVTALF